MGLAVWRDISLLWLILWALIPALILGAILFYAIKGMRRLRQLAGQYLPLAQAKAALVADRTEAIGHKIVSPLIAVQARAAQVNGIVQSVLSRRKNV